MIQSVYELLTDAVKNNASQPAARFKFDGVWKDLTWAEVLERTHLVSTKLIELGILPGDRVVLLSGTCLEWVLADLGIIAAGACTVPIYHSSVQKDASYIYENCEAKLAIVEDETAAKKIPNAKTLNLSEIFASEPNLAEINKRTEKIKPDDLATIIYTSGTTGEPKGACLTHDNFIYEAQAIEKIGLLSSKDVQLLFLPLAHVFARVMEIAWLKTGHILCFAESIERAVENMREVKPTFMAAVPRVYEKVHAKVLAKARSGGALKKAIAMWAIGRQVKDRGFRWSIAKKLVFEKLGQTLNETFGGRLRFFISGGAPLNPEIASFFKHADITVLEGYGLTETTAASCVNLPTKNMIGTVGKPLPGTEVKIAEDGEILIKGRGVFKEYFKRPEQTKEALSEDKWFRTGDIGEILPGGFLKITDRKKDLIVTAGGKKIAPQKLENLFKTKTSLISQVLVHGDQKNFLVALVTLDEAAVLGLARRKGVPGTYAALTQNDQIKQRIQRALDSMNEHLASFEQIKKFKILDHDFEVGDQLTPTLKVKRAHCSSKYAAELEAIYPNSARR